MGQLFIDAYGHETAPGGVQLTSLTAGAVSTSAAGTVSPTTSAGSTPTVTAVTANDRNGSFTINPVTGGGAQAAGQVALVRFKQAYGAIPKTVLVTAVNTTDGTASITVSANNITAAGFDVFSTILTTAKAYLVNYLVIP